MSHIGSGWCVSFLGAYSPPMSHWLHLLCPIVDLALMKTNRGGLDVGGDERD